MIRNIVDMNPGDIAVVTGFQARGGSYRRKLLSMGVTRGVKIEFIKAAPLGDPVEIRVRGYSLSLRKEEAAVLELGEGA